MCEEVKAELSEEQRRVFGFYAHEQATPQAGTARAALEVAVRFRKAPGQRVGQGMIERPDEAAVLSVTA